MSSMTDRHSDLDALLADLTEPQREAVLHVEGPLLVLAGPGSGKTRVITRRIAHLVLGVGIAPWNVLAITFTNKAAGEMRQRVGQMLSPRQARAMPITTFHSLCARLIREFGDRLGLDPRFSIYDTADQQRAMKQALESLDMSTSNFPPAKVLATISNAKNELLDPETYASVASDFYHRKVAQAYRKYESILRQNNALDFDDLLLMTVQLLRQHADVLEQLQERHQYILIDEYQDTNHAQFVIANTLAGKRQNICATGDPDQSIYRWRGADIRNILDFETHYPDAKVVRLEQNYRSTKNILAAADGLIRHNVRRKHKALWTENEPGDPVTIVVCPTEREEARWVVDQFCQLHDMERIPWSSMAVFYRVNSLSRAIEDELRHRGIPYQIARGTAFYERKEIKDAVAYLRAISNPADEVNLLRIINTPARGISSATIKALQAHAAAHHTTLPQLLDNPQQVTTLNPRAISAVSRFGAQLEAWRKVTERMDVTLRSFLEQVLRESGLESFYAADDNDPDEDRAMNLGELVSSAQQFEDELEFADMSQDESTLGRRLQAFLERISLVSDVDSVDADQGSVTLMTLHAAKGLEFPVVAITGVEEGLLPHDRAVAEAEEVEEERRLCFVGVTRAMQRLYLTCTQRRTVFGQTLPTTPSRFLRELPRETVVTQELDDFVGDVFAGESRFGVAAEQRRRAAEDARMYPPGTRVRHPQFGIGRVLNVSPAGAHTRARIEFGSVGIKTLVLQYARLEVLDRPDLPF